MKVTHDWERVGTLWVLHLTATEGNGWRDIHISENSKSECIEGAEKQLIQWIRGNRSLATEVNHIGYARFKAMLSYLRKNV